MVRAFGTTTGNMGWRRSTKKGKVVMDVAMEVGD